MVNGAHDLGGWQNLGRVAVEHDDEVFHAPYEGAVFALCMATVAQGLYNLDEFRYARERLDSRTYLRTRYFELWLAGLETCLIENGVVTLDELEARAREYAENPDADLPSRIDPDLTSGLVAGIRNGASFQRDVPEPPRFKVGDRVRTRVDSTPGHTRLPQYARGRECVVERVHGAFPLPDKHALGLGENPEYSYQVRFDAADLWGAAAEPNSTVLLDVWESYLDA